MRINATLLGGDSPRTFALKGRMGWTMVQLVEAGPQGVTPLDRPALRWSGYIHELRKRGFAIETEMEHHTGPYRGVHARYRLACQVTIERLGGDA